MHFCAFCTLEEKRIEKRKLGKREKASQGNVLKEN